MAYPLSPREGLNGGGQHSADHAYYSRSYHKEAQHDADVTTNSGGQAYESGSAPVVPPITSSRRWGGSAGATCRCRATCRWRTMACASWRRAQEAHTLFIPPAM